MAKPCIKMYYDVVSPYAWIGVEVLRRYQAYWGDRVDVQYIPFFLGGIMQGAKNRPPISVPAKGLYMQRDLARSGKLTGMAKFKQPTVFPIQSYKQMRVICALQGAADKGQIDKNVPWNVAERLWKALWNEDKNTSDESVMQAELDPLLPGGWEKWKYAINDPDVKKRLIDLTQEALDQGCFGAPWWDVTNKNGERDMFFGSDRWEHVCDFLGEKYLGYFPQEAARAML